MLIITKDRISVLEAFDSLRAKTAIREPKKVTTGKEETEKKFSIRKSFSKGEKSMRKGNKDSNFFLYKLKAFRSSLFFVFSKCKPKPNIREREVWNRPKCRDKHI